MDKNRMGDRREMEGIEAKREKKKKEWQVLTEVKPLLLVPEGFGYCFLEA